MKHDSSLLVEIGKRSSKVDINKFALLWGEAQLFALCLLIEKIAYSYPKVTYSYPRVTYSDPRVTYSDPKVTYSDPKVTYSDPKVSTVTLHTSSSLHLPHLSLIRPLVE